MDEKTLIAKRVALEPRPGHLVNHGIGLPTIVPSMVPLDAGIFFQSENGRSGPPSPALFRRSTACPQCRSEPHRGLTRSATGARTDDHTK